MSYYILLFLSKTRSVEFSLVNSLPQRPSINTVRNRIVNIFKLASISQGAPRRISGGSVEEEKKIEGKVEEKEGEEKSEVGGNSSSNDLDKLIKDIR